MGPNSRDEGAARREQLSLTAQIVPDLATFAVDDGFAYAVPEALGPIEVGSIVRVPLGRRRVRGYVVDLSLRDRASSDRQLKEVISVSGEIPIFDERMLRTLRWLATHYVAPLAAVLPRAAPPNLPRRRALDETAGSRAAGASVLPAATAAATAGSRIRPHYYVSGRFGGREAAGLLSDVLEAGRNGVVVAATVAEAEAIYRAMKTELDARVVTAHSSLPARDVTAAWTRAATQGGLAVVGTREVALWPIHGLAMGIVVEEGRRAMKAPQTPTMHVREILRRRAAIERFQLVIAGLVPTSEAVAAGFEINEPPGRVWPLVEIVDRNDEPPGSGFVSERVRQSLSIAVKARKSVFVLVNRRGYAPAFRCLRCKEVRRCSACGNRGRPGRHVPALRRGTWSVQAVRRRAVRAAGSRRRPNRGRAQTLRRRGVGSRRGRSACCGWDRAGSACSRSSRRFGGNRCRRRHIWAQLSRRRGCPPATGPFGGNRSPRQREPLHCADGEPAAPRDHGTEKRSSHGLPHRGVGGPYRGGSAAGRRIDGDRSGQRTSRYRCRASRRRFLRRPRSR